MQVVGHGDIVSRLMGVLPPVSLFVGPSSVGKWTTAEHLRGVHQVRSGDTLRIRGLTMDEARSIVRFASSAPLGDRKLAIVRIDGASVAALNALLKTLEELPPTSHVILIGTELPMQTVVSRSEVAVFALLSEDEVTEVLIQRNFKPTEAKRYATLAGGQVKKALEYANGLDSKVTVLSAVRAIRERQERSLDNLAGKWTDEHTTLLAALCREVITGRWRIFSEAEVEGIGQRLPLKILASLRSDIRPRLVVRSSLMSVLKEAA